LAKEAIEAEAFRAQLGSENGERYALQFRQAMQDLRRDFVPTPAASAPEANSQAFTMGFVPRAKLTKPQEELRKKALSRSVPHGPVRPVWRVDWTWTTTCSPVRVPDLD
jgi:hypothetical protein